MLTYKRIIEKIPEHRRPLVDKVVFGVALLGVLGAAWWAWHEYRTSAPYVDPERYPVRGIDVSAHNGMINMQAVADAGYRFVFIKASEGENFRDENFRMNYEKAQAAQLRTGAYHFYRFDADPVKQAHNVHNVLNGSYLDLGVAIDVEAHGNPSGYSAQEVSRGVVKMAQLLQRYGYHVLIYTNRDGYYDYIEPCEELHDYSLWICWFYQTPLDAPWEFWQFDHHGRVPGVRGDVDINVYHGSLQEWDNLFPGDI